MKSKIRNRIKIGSKRKIRMEIGHPRSARSHS